MNRQFVCLFPTLVALTFVGGARAAENWPQWRGPDGNGISDSTNLPTTWSLEKNIVWKTPLPWWSGGTPVVWGDRIFVTSPTKSDPAKAKPETQQSFPRQRRDPGGSTLLLICISKYDGAEFWRRELDEGNQIWNKQNDSSPSPVTDGNRVWVVTGTGTVTAFDMDGNHIWKRNLQRDYGAFGLNWGYGSSPLLYNGKLIIEVLHGQKTDDPSYVVALDAATGKQRWRQERPTDAVNESPDAYTTPTLLTSGGKRQIVISGGDYVTGHDPETGEEIWRAAGLNPTNSPNNRIIASPIVADGMIYAPTRKTPLLALHAGGRGDVTTSHLAWKWESRGGPDVPTPLCDGKYFYMVDDRGLVTCLGAKSGKVIWGPKRTATGIVSASPLLADGNIYITNEGNVTTIVAAGPKFKLISTNRLDGTYTLSSIAVSGERLFLRTSTHLYCIGTKSAG